MDLRRMRNELGTPTPACIRTETYLNTIPNRSTQKITIIITITGTSTFERWLLSATFGPQNRLKHNPRSIFELSEYFMTRNKRKRNQRIKITTGFPIYSRQIASTYTRQQWENPFPPIRRNLWRFNIF